MYDQQNKSRLVRFYEWLIVFSPWALLLGLFHYQFQSLLPYQRIFRGLQFFDFITITDVFIGFLFLIFLIGFCKKQILFAKRTVPVELVVTIAFLALAAMLQLLFQTPVEPILSTPFEYFRSLFVFPLIFLVLIMRTANDVLVARLLKSYFWMIAVFCVLALVQHFSGIFAGEQQDFMGRLVWPFVDFVTLKSSSANWAAFFTTPALILSCIAFFDLARQKRGDRSAKVLLFYGAVFALCSAAIYLTQSYGAYIAIFASLALYFFRALPFKKFIGAALVMLVIAGGVYVLQKNTWKYQVFTGSVAYRYENSVASRWDIYKMGLEMVKSHPLLGVGMNQYQSYFAAHQKEVLGTAFNESHTPPHAHNFFLSFWTSLGVFGFLAMVILVLGIFLRTKLSSDYPAVFVLIAIMIHGLVDSYYWKQEIAYTFWLAVALCYLHRAHKPKTPA